MLLRRCCWKGSLDTPECGCCVLFDAESFASGSLAGGASGDGGGAGSGVVGVDALGGDDARAAVA